jgi:phage-related tail fiber protein
VKVENLNADKLDGADLETSLTFDSDILIPTSKAVAEYVSTEIGSSFAGVQPANTVFAGPTSGDNASPEFRSLINDDLPDSGVAAGTYSAVEVNSKGVVTEGGQFLEVGYYTSTPTEETNKPTFSLVMGGLFFEALEATGS